MTKRVKFEYLMDIIHPYFVTLQPTKYPLKIHLSSSQGTKILFVSVPLELQDWLSRVSPPTPKIHWNKGEHEFSAVSTNLSTPMPKSTLKSWLVHKGSFVWASNRCAFLQWYVQLWVTLGFPDKQSQVDRPTGGWLNGWVDGQMDVYIENVQTLIYYRI